MFLLLRLQSLKHDIKKELQATSQLREQILDGMFRLPSESVTSTRGSATLRKLLSKQAPPRADPREVHALKRKIEIAKFRVKLLGEQRDIVQIESQKKLMEKNKVVEKNQDKGKYNITVSKCILSYLVILLLSNMYFITVESELMENFYCLRRDAEKKRGLKIELDECKCQSLQTSALLEKRRRELISQLSYIYPISQVIFLLHYQEIV